MITAFSIAAHEAAELADSSAPALITSGEVHVLAEAVEMSEGKKSSVGRVESFKTSLAKQKQRLSRQTQVKDLGSNKVFKSIMIQINNQFDKTKVEKDLKKKDEEGNSTKVLLQMFKHRITQI